MSEFVLYVSLARNAKRLMEASLHSRRLAEGACEWWHREYFRRRAFDQRKHAWDFLNVARAAKRRELAA